jgi:L-methionine (R)-S-oxide reductase
LRLPDLLDFWNFTITSRMGKIMAEKETQILKKIESLIRGKKDRDEILNRVVRILKESFSYYTWVGVYLLKKDELVLGPFLGKPSPHMRIKLDKGICGAAAKEKKTVIVPDVKSDPRYLACSLETKSEIVVPIMKRQKVFGEIDIDSDKPDAFGENDKKLLEEIAEILASMF